MIRILFFLLISIPAFAQSPYESVDKIMRNYDEKVKSSDDLYKVVNFIRTRFSSDTEKVRAAFIWITENIAYDVKAYMKQDPSAARLDYVIKHKKAICSGYSALLKYFCDGLGIGCEVVEGRARSGKKDINISQSTYRTNHAWNVVKIGEEWRVIDPTWASGSVDDRDEENLKFIKDFKEVYFFTPPQKFVLNHFPKIPKYGLLEKAITINQYTRRPLLTTEFIQQNIDAVSPDTALLKVRVGDSLKLRFKTDAPDRQMIAWSEYKKAGYTGTAIQKNGWLEFTYPVSTVGYYNLYIGDYKPGFNSLLIAYRIEADPKK